MSSEVNINNYIPLPDPIKITEHQWPSDIKPLVSIRTMAYNHENYIRECLEGVLMQKTTFPVEFLIHDDASTDNTAAIIKEYEKRYPNVIKAYYQTENSYSKNPKEKRRLRQNFFLMFKGKYIALCEGDDYWIDPLKLQKQVSFLEENDEYGLVHTKAKVFNQTTGKMLDDVIGDPNNTYFDFLMKNRIATVTVVLRNSLIKEYRKEVKPGNMNWKMGDYPLWIWISRRSKIMFLPDSTVVRRLVKGSVSNQQDREKQIEFLRSTIQIKKYFISKYSCTEEKLKAIKEKIAIDKIKAAVINQSYDLYTEGIREKKKLNSDITMFERMYGVILRSPILTNILVFILKYRKRAL